MGTGDFRSGVWVSLFSVVLLSIAGLTEGNNYSYCINGGVNRITRHNGFISSNLEGQGYYQSGMNCTWIVDAGEGGRVHVTVLSSSLQYTPTQVTCSDYDHMEIRDGESSKSDVIVTWCGSRNPKTFISSGRHLHIHFITKSNSNAGIRLQYETFDDSLCPPGWIDFSSNCYKLNTVTTYWENAHTTCTYDRSNLVSIASKTEQTFLANHVNSMTSGMAYYVWMGIRYVQQSSDWLWIDTANTYLQSGWTKSGTTSGSGCACLITSTDSWISKLCTMEYMSVCKMRKGASTDIFSIPVDKKTDRGEGGYWEFIVAGISVLIVLCFMGNLIKNKCVKTSQSASQTTFSLQVDQSGSATQVQAARTQADVRAPQIQGTRLGLSVSRLQNRISAAQDGDNGGIENLDDSFRQKHTATNADMPDTGDVRAQALAPISSPFYAVVPPEYSSDSEGIVEFSNRTAVLPVSPQRDTPPPSYEEVFGSGTQKQIGE